MGQIFKSVLLLSCVGGVLTVIFLLLKPIAQKAFHPRWQYWVWICVLVVMVLPVRIRLPVSVVSVPHTQAVQMPPQNTVSQPEMQQGNHTGAQSQMPPPPASGSLNVGATNLMMALPYLWLFGALFSFCWSLLQYWRFLFIIRKSSRPVTCETLDEAKSNLHIHRHIQVRISDTTTAPLMVGLFQATLLLPSKAMQHPGLEDILCHELIHLRHQDIACKWFALLVRCVHWFNPCVYFICKQLDESCEISCDFAVTGNMDETEKRHYMSTILSLAAPQKAQHLITSMASSKKQMERRFTMMLTVKRPSRITSLLSILVAALLVSTSVLVSGVAAGAVGLGSGEHIVIEVSDGVNRLEFTKPPFISNNVVYLPLRETMLKFGLPDENIRWGQGQTIDILASDGATFHCIIGDVNISGTVGDISPYVREGIEGYPILLQTDFPMDNAPILKGNTTYVPYEFFHHMQIVSSSTLSGFTVRCLRDGQLYSEPTLLRLTRNDMIVLSRKSTDGTELTKVDLEGYISAWEREAEARYDADGGYYLLLREQNNGLHFWLYNDGSAPGYDLKVNSAINIAVCYYDGLPWWK